MVPGAKHFLGLGIPNDEGKHSPQLLQDVLAPLFITVQDNFRIGVGSKGMPLFNQLAAEFFKVIDFPVKLNKLGLIFIKDGLIPRLNIHKTQPAEPQGHVIIHVLALVVRAPVDDPVLHLLD